MKTVRFDEMVNAAFLKSGESQLDQFRQMWKKAVSGRKEYSEMVTVAFYREIHSVIPEEWDDNPVKRELLFNYPVVP